MANELSDVLLRISRGLPQAVDDAIFVGTNNVNAEMTARIFQDGGGSDINGDDFGEYKEYPSTKTTKFQETGNKLNTKGKREGLFRGWKGIRQQNGRQIGQRDFIFSTQLQDSLKTVKISDGYGVKFKNLAQAEKGRGLEDLLKSEGKSGKVFEASNEEIKELTKDIRQELEKFVERAAAN